MRDPCHNYSGMILHMYVSECLGNLMEEGSEYSHCLHSTKTGIDFPSRESHFCACQQLRLC